MGAITSTEFWRVFEVETLKGFHFFLDLLKIGRCR